MTMDDDDGDYGVDSCLGCGDEESIQTCAECGTMICVLCYHEFDDSCFACPARPDDEEVT